MTEETRDRSAMATMFGRIVLKNKLVDEAALKKVMAGLPAGSDLGEALVSAGLISAQHAAAIQKKIDERMGSATASQGATSGAAQSAAATPAGTGPTVADVQRMDFTEMSGQPIAEYLRKLYGMPVTKVHTANYDGKEKRDPRDPTKRQTHQSPPARPPTVSEKPKSQENSKQRKTHTYFYLFPLHSMIMTITDSFLVYRRNIY